MKKLKYPLKLLLNIFNNSIPNNMSKWDYKKPVSMNKRITLFLKKKKKLTKKCYSDATNHSANLLANTPNECTRLIKEVK